MRKRSIYWVSYKDSNGKLSSKHPTSIKRVRAIISEVYELLIVWKTTKRGKHTKLEVFDCHDKSRIGKSYTLKYYSKEELKVIRARLK